MHFTPRKPLPHRPYKRRTLLWSVAALLLFALGGCSTTGGIAAHIEPTTGARLAIVQAAASQLDTPYRAGARGPSAFDDNSLVRYAYRAAGTAIPLAIHAQLGAGQPIGMIQAAPGDLVFYQTELAGGEDSLHVGLYLNDSEMLYASNQRGEVVIQPIDGDYWTQRLLGLVKILP